MGKSVIVRRVIKTNHTFVVVDTDRGDTTVKGIIVVEDSNS